MIRDEGWFKDTFLPTVQQRGAAIIKARGLSSAASAANAVVEPSATSQARPARETGSVSPCARTARTAIESGLMFSFPIRSDGTKWQIVQDVKLTDFSKSKIAATENELKEEKALVAELLPK